MKKLLIIVNTVLVFLLALSLWGAFSASGSSMPVLSARKKKNPKPAAAAAPAVSSEKFKFPASAEAAEIAVQKNIFDNQRTGGIVAGRGPTTYSLVGVTCVGNVQSAVILIKGQRRDRNAAAQKQYFRVGDQLPNGYTLSVIEPTGVVLSRGSSTINLPLANASENFPAAARRTRQPNQMQQMLNLMRQQMNMQQRQQMNMMRMMQQNNQQAPARGGSTNSRGRSR